MGGDFTADLLLWFPYDLSQDIAVHEGLEYSEAGPFSFSLEDQPQTWNPAHNLMGIPSLTELSFSDIFGKSMFVS